MRNKINILIFLFLIGFKLTGQEQLPIYNQYLFGSYFLINPAVAGIDNQWKVSLIHRQQWLGLKDAPNTQSFAAEGALFKGLKMGGYLFLDQNGYHKQTGYNLAFSYVIALADESKSLKRLSLGISFSGGNRFIDQQNILTINDPALNFGQIKYTSSNTNVGAFLMWEGFYAGIAGAHLLSGSYDESDYQNSYFPRNYNVILGNKIKLNDTYFVEASAMARVIEKYDNHLDLNAKFYYRPKIHRNDANYWTGVSYRLSWKEIPISSVSIAGFIGGSYNNFYYGYSYEAMIAKLQFHHTGSHQFMLGYTISMKGDRHCGCTPFSIPTL
jgi:type IX secretion system PorP/SprF family membrane protein